MTQRRPNPYFLRASATSSQAMHPMADYAAKELKLKRMITISEDFAFGYEQMGGFQQTFEDNGGKILKKLWPPIVTPDYAPYLAQIADCDGVCQGFAGSNPLRFLKQYAAAGLKFPVVTGETGGDDALLRSFGDEAVGLYSACPYTLDLDTESNKRFVAAMNKDYGVDPGFYCAGLYVNGMVVEAGLQKTGGKSDDKTALMAAMKSVALTDTPRGPIKFDHLGNVDRRNLHPRASRRPATNTSTRRSRPTTTSASSGLTTRRSSSNSRSIRAIIRRSNRNGGSTAGASTAPAASMDMANAGPLRT